MATADNNFGTEYSGFFALDFPPSLKNGGIFNEMAVTEIQLNESLLSASLETSILFQSSIHTLPMKNYDDFRNSEVKVKMANPNIMTGPDDPFILETTQRIYRLENRKPMSYQLENFTIKACDQSLLNNEVTRVSDYYKCLTPSEVAHRALSALGVANVDIEESFPPRDYNAANIPPFQILAEQAEVALATNDPSFLHFMTFKNGATHNFKSLRTMANQSPVWSYVYNVKGLGGQLGNPYNIMAYEFPCDFDLLSDIQNGVGMGTSVISMNPFSGSTGIVGGNINEAGGMGNGNNVDIVSDINTTDDNCGVQAEDYTPLRKSRIGLIQPEMISLRLLVPFNPLLHAGEMINVAFHSSLNGELDYGSGDYLIVNMNHTIKTGGYGVTTMELVSRSIGHGEV